MGEIKTSIYLTRTFVDTNDDGIVDTREQTATITTSRCNNAGDLVRREVATDSGADGKIEATDTVSYAYDQDRNQVQAIRTYDSNGDGPSDYTETTRSAYDQNHHLVARTVETDPDGDGLGGIDSLYRYAARYDAAGNLVYEHTETDRNFEDDAVNDTTTHITEYDAAGRVRAIHDEHVFDSDGDGALDRSTSDVLWDERGNITSSTGEFDYDYLAKNGVEYRDVYTYVFGPDDQLLAKTYDWLDPSRHQILTFSYDSRGNWTGFTDRIWDTASGNLTKSSVSSSTYDDQGHKLSEVSTSDGDGDGPAKPSTNSYQATYDPHGNPLTETSERDDDGDGSPDWRQVTTWEYDAAGRLLARHEVDDWDGEGPQKALSQSYQVTYDSRGNKSTEAWQRDDDGDEVSDQTTTTTHTNRYDLGGHLLSVASKTVTVDASGTSVASDYLAYDVQGHVLREEHSADYDGDGKPDFRSTVRSAYDAQGRLILAAQEQDQGADGTIDLRSTDRFAFDRLGNKTLESHQSDGDGDGQADYRVVDRYTFDPQGHRIGETHQADRDGNGILEYRITETFDAQGRPLRTLSEIDDDQDGIAVRYLTRDTYAANGQVIDHVSASDQDGKDGYENLYRNTYDAAGRQLSYFEQGDDDRDGTVDHMRVERWTYDATGRLIAEVHKSDFDADGNLDYRSVGYLEESGVSIAQLDAATRLEPPLLA